MYNKINVSIKARLIIRRERERAVVVKSFHHKKERKTETQ
jgi:hypothetical protein